MSVLSPLLEAKRKSDLAAGRAAFDPHSLDPERTFDLLDVSHKSPTLYGVRSRDADRCAGETSL